MENDRKKRLYALKQERQAADQADTNGPETAGLVSGAEMTEGDDINRFLKDIVQRKKERKKQLEIIHDFFENPAAYGVDTDLIPSSTTTEEVAERKKDLQHKLDLLRSVLKALEGEMQLLCQMKQPDEEHQTQAQKNRQTAAKAAARKRVAKKKIASKKKAVKKKPGA